jgi:hypothetical protein
MMARTRTLTAFWLLSAAMTAATLVACDGRKEAGAATENTAAVAPAPETKPFAPSRDTPEHTAHSIRELAKSTWDPAFIVEYIDPSQKWTGSGGGAQTGGAPALVGPALIYFSRLHDLRSAAIEKFGDEAGPAIDESATFFQIEALGNGLREMFGAAKLEQVNQIGPLAYVAPLDETNEQVGASIVVRENQGEWLWVLLEGNTPWDQKRIGFFTAFLAKPLEGSIEYARAYETMAERVRAGEYGTLSELVESIRTLPSRIG